MLEDPDDFTIVRSTVELAHNLGLRVVAEGVETAEAMGALTRIGCDLAQGYHASRPIPADELVDCWPGPPGTADRRGPGCPGKGTGD